MLRARFLTLALLLIVSVPAGSEVINGFSIEDPLIPVDEILPGGPPKDGIPAILDPVFVSMEATDFLSGSDRVLGIEKNGIARAYPIKILNYHEIVNDDVGEPVIITFCPLCGTGIAFSAVVDGETHTFGVSGLLYNSDVLMYDHQTESLWSQIAAKAVTGKKKGATLRRLPVSHTTWADWSSRNPDTVVLSIETGHNRNYYRDPYAGYADRDGIAFPVAHSDDRFGSKELVIGLEIDGRFKAYPLSTLPQGRTRIEDRVSGRDVVVEYDRDDMTGRVLDPTTGREIPTFIAFWFAWIAFHPETAVYSQ